MLSLAQDVPWAKGLYAVAAADRKVMFLVVVGKYVFSMDCHCPVHLPFDGTLWSASDDHFLPPAALLESTCHWLNSCYSLENPV